VVVMQRVTKMCISPECGSCATSSPGRPRWMASCLFATDADSALRRTGVSSPDVAPPRRRRWRCKRPFDVSGRSCGRCEAHLPAAFFYQNSISCISCAREYHRHKSEGIVVPAPPAQKQCTRCHRTWSAIISSCTAPFLMIMLQS